MHHVNCKKGNAFLDVPNNGSQSQPEKVIKNDDNSYRLRSFSLTSKGMEYSYILLRSVTIFYNTDVISVQSHEKKVMVEYNNTPVHTTHTVICKYICCCQTSLRIRSLLLISINFNDFIPFPIIIWVINAHVNKYISCQLNQLKFPNHNYICFPSLVSMS